MAGKKRTASQFDYDLAKKYIDGAWIVDLSREYDIPCRTIRRSIRRAGCQMRPKQGNLLSRNGSWKGGRTIDKSGYVLIHKPEHPDANYGGYVREHRLLMEQHLGRFLLKTEVVHHLNNDKSDNRIENLSLYYSNSKHLAHELKGRVPKWTEDGLNRIHRGLIVRWLHKYHQQEELCVVQ